MPESTYQGEERSVYMSSGALPSTKTSVHEGSKRPVVAAGGLMVVQRRRWIGMELMMGAESPVGRR